MEGRSSPSYGRRSSENEIVSDDDSGFKKSIRKKSSSATRSPVPRSKILRESSDFSNTHHRKSPNFERNSLPKKYPNSRYSSDPDYEDQNSDVTTCSLKPYDPLTNYLSPRPKFLRYNPDRRREIFLNTVNKVRELEFDFDTQHFSVEDESSSVCSSKEDIENVIGDKAEVNEVVHCDADEEDEEIEEFVEESGWFLKGVLKFLFVVVTVLLSTLYISTMNSSAPSFSLDGYLKFRNTSFLLAGNQTALEELNMVIEDDMSKWGKNVEIHDQIMPQIGQYEVVLDDEFEATSEIQDSTQIQGSETEDYPIAVYSPFVLKIKEEISTPEDEVLEILPLHEKCPVEDSIKSGRETKLSSTPIQIIRVCLLLAFVAVLCVAQKLKKVRSRVVSEKAGEMKNVEKDEIGREDEGRFVSEKAGEMKNVEKEEIGGEDESRFTSPVPNPNEMMMMSYSAGLESKIFESKQENNSAGSVSHLNNSAGSVSYGSITTQKKILKKEKQRGKVGEVNMVITTPVRRSSRLLNRGLTSP